MPIPERVDAYLDEHRTARKRAGRAARLGYRFASIDRHLFEHDIYVINKSAPERQGRPMSAGYHDRPAYGPNPIVCPHHHVYTYGVTDPTGRLTAYLWLYRAGQLALVSSILGHHDHLESGLMYLLFTSAVADQWLVGPGTVFYNRWDSGTDGLRFFKTRVGLREGDIEWAL